MDILEGKQIVIRDKLDKYITWPQICLMTKNITVDEYKECLALSPELASDSAQSFLQ